MASRLDHLRMLAELAKLTALDEGSPQAFRVRAYENAIHALEGHTGEISGLDKAQLTEINGIGPSTADKIIEFETTGRVAKLDALREKYPPAFVELTKIPGLGPKTLKLLRSELGVEDIDGLRAAIEAERLRELPGMGKISEEKMGRAIERLGLHGKDRRTPLVEALPLARALAARLGALASVVAAVPCGSVRRFAESVGDIDIVVVTDDPVAVAGGGGGGAAATGGGGQQAREQEGALELARDGGPLIVSDEIYHGLSYGGRDRSILEFTDRAFVLNGFSKAYAMTGYRLGYVIAPSSHIRALQRLYGNFFISTNEFVQWAGVTALREAGEESRRFRAIFDERRRVMIAGLRAIGLGVGFEPTGAFYVLANARHLSKDSVSLAYEILESCHVGVTPGAAFGANAEGYLRFSYAASLDRIQEGLARLGRFLAAKR